MRGLSPGNRDPMECAAVAALSNWQSPGPLGTSPMPDSGRDRQCAAARRPRILRSTLQAPAGAVPAVMSVRGKVVVELGVLLNRPGQLY